MIQTEENFYKPIKTFHCGFFSWCICYYISIFKPYCSRWVCFSSPTSGCTHASTSAFRPGWTAGLRLTWRAKCLPTLRSGWREKHKKDCCRAPPPAALRSSIISTLPSTGWSTEHCSALSSEAGSTAREETSNLSVLDTAAKTCRVVYTCTFLNFHTTLNILNFTCLLKVLKLGFTQVAFSWIAP